MDRAASEHQAPSNRVFIAASLDGYIADMQGGVGFLDMIPMPEGDQMGYDALMTRIDAILMGRKSFETVLGFGVEWPYAKPVFVWSETITSVPDALRPRVRLVKGGPLDVLASIHREGYRHLYVDGGRTIQSFLNEDLIDEMTITTIPVLLGRGVPLFGVLDRVLTFRCVASTVYENGVSQQVYARSRR
jgi:dihydrofolate reductase